MNYFINIIKFSIRKKELFVKDSELNTLVGSLGKNDKIERDR